jgi:hypothetical protein
MHDEKLLTCCCLAFSGWVRERLSLVFDYKGGQYIRKRQPYTNVKFLPTAIEYLNATRNRKTQKPELGINTKWGNQTR